VEAIAAAFADRARVGGQAVERLAHIWFTARRSGARDCAAGAVRTGKSRGASARIQCAGSSERRRKIVTPTVVAKLSRGQQRALALALFIGAVAVALAAVLGPVVLMHRHYDHAI